MFLLSETHFTQKSHCYVPGYKFYQVMHPDGRAHGGSAIFIKNTIKHHQGQHFCCDEIQATNVIVEDWHGMVTVSSVYSPPKHNIKQELYETFFKSLGGRFLACGDFNAKHYAWGSRLISPKGRQLHSAIRNLNLNITSPNSPTYWPTDINKIPDLIDFCVSKGVPSKSQNCSTCLELSSDHSPVLLTISTELKYSTQSCKLHSKSTNWITYRQLICDSLDTKLPLRSDDDIIKAVEHFVTTVQNAAWNSTPPPEFCKHTKVFGCNPKKN